MKISKVEIVVWVVLIILCLLVLMIGYHNYSKGSETQTIGEAEINESCIEYYTNRHIEYADSVYPYVINSLIISEISRHYPTWDIINISYNEIRVVDVYTGYQCIKECPDKKEGCIGVIGICRNHYNTSCITVVGSEEFGDIYKRLYSECDDTYRADVYVDYNVTRRMC